MDVAVPLINSNKRYIHLYSIQTKGTFTYILFKQKVHSLVFCCLVHPCDKLPVPTNGALVCNQWQREFGEFCMGFCNTDYAKGLQGNDVTGTMYVCGASGHWLPNTALKDCKCMYIFSHCVVAYLFFQTQM